MEKEKNIVKIINWIYEVNYINGQFERKGKLYLENGEYMIIESKNGQILKGNYSLFDKNGTLIKKYEYKIQDF